MREHVSNRDETPAIRRGRRPVRKWGMILVLGLAALYAIVLHPMTLKHSEAALQRAVAGVEAAGSSLDPWVIYPEAPVPEENAHEALEAARRILESDRDLAVRVNEVIQGDILTGGALPTDEDLELFARAVRRYEPLFQVLDDAFPIEVARLPLNREIPTFEQLPFLNAIEHFANLLCARAHLAMADGRPADAWRDIRMVFRIAAWSAEEMPILVNQLMAYTAARLGSHGVRSLLGFDVPPSEVMQEIVTEARRWDPGARLEIAMEMERAEVVTWWLNDERREKLFPNESLGTSLLYRSPFGRPWLRWNLAVYIDAIGKISADCRQAAFSRPQVIGHPGAFEEHYPMPSWALLSHRLASTNLIEVCNKRDITTVYLDQVEIAFALEEHRRRHGTYPPSLDVLAGIPTVDPFSGAPYVYRLTGSGALFYSVGINRVDDGGTPPPLFRPDMNWNQNRNHGDLPWRLEG